MRAKEDRLTGGFSRDVGWLALLVQNNEISQLEYKGNLTRSIIPQSPPSVPPPRFSVFWTRGQTGGTWTTPMSVTYAKSFMAGETNENALLMRFIIT